MLENNEQVKSSPYVRLRRTTITVTLRCTLKCKLCSADVINYVNPPHYDYTFIAKEIDRYFQIVDYVEWLQFSGGEPFMNKELSQMIEKAMEYSKQFDKLMIFANGTILPTETMIATMKKHKDKIQIFISHYGDISCKANELMETLELNNLRYDIKKYYGENQHHGGWIDFGGWDKRNLTENELIEKHSRCAVPGIEFTVLQNGEFHLCRMSYRGMELGEVARNDANYLNIFDNSISIDKMKEKINMLMNTDYIDACDYCSGDFGTSDKVKRFKPAEQL